MVRTLVLTIAAVVGVLVPPSAAHARPNADVVIVWAPGLPVAPIGTVAREAGAAMIDRSPAPAAAPPTARLVERGIAAYDALQLADAARLLDEARALADRTGGAGLEKAALSDLFLYRALVKTQGGDPTAWDELVTATIVAPTRVLDPGRFPPRVVGELERARATLADRATAQLTIAAPAGCSVRVDGVAAGRATGPDPIAAGTRLVGPHWIDATCPDRAPWGTRIELTGDTLITARNAPQAPPSLDDMLIQARTAGARAFVALELRDRIATVRLVGIDGRELDRRTVAIAGTLAPAAPLVRALLVPVVETAPRWYRSRWVWAAGAALLAVAIAIPVTAAVARDDTPTSWSATPGNVPPTWGTR